jgi:adenylylsulfate kinase
MRKKPHESPVSRKDRQRLNGHKSAVLWLTGLSGAGKTTLAQKLEKKLHAQGIRTYLLDGDIIRKGLSSDLGFSPEDREEHIRRIGEVSGLFVDAGVVVIAAVVSPYSRDRETARKLVGKGEFVEIYVKCPLEVCRKRDVKGFYEKAAKGLVSQFTGIDAPYEAPENPEIVVETDRLSVSQCVEKIAEYLKEKKIM